MGRAKISRLRPRTKWQKFKRWVLHLFGLRKGFCVGCGKRTRRFDYAWDWFICNQHTSAGVSLGIAEHGGKSNGKVKHDQ